VATQVSLPIFPLPDLTLFPHTMLPLHIFEARYRAMITDCLSRDRRLAVVGLRPGYEASYDGRPAVYEVMGVGRIVQWERMATGRYNLLLQGQCRARTGAEGPAVAALTSRVKSRCAQILATVGRQGAELQETLDALTEPGRLCDQVASTLVPSPATRQALLEELHVERRLERLAAALDDLLSHLTGEGGRA